MAVFRKIPIGLKRWDVGAKQNGGNWATNGQSAQVKQHENLTDSLEHDGRELLTHPQ